MSDETITTTIATYKGFDSNLQCRGFQYKVGNTYHHAGPVVACGSGFHACENPLDVWSYYGPTDSRFAVVEQGGQIARDTGDTGDTKIASAEITIRAEIKMPEIIRAAVKWISERASGDAATTGDRANAATTGYGANAATTGKNSIACSLGLYGSVRASLGGIIILVSYDDDGTPNGVFASRAGENGIEPDVDYRLTSTGQLERVAP